MTYDMTSLCNNAGINSHETRVLIDFFLSLYVIDTDELFGTHFSSVHTYVYDLGDAY